MVGVAFAVRLVGVVAVALAVVVGAVVGAVVADAVVVVFTFTVWGVAVVAVAVGVGVVGVVGGESKEPAMSTYPNARDCKHGRQRGKCDACDLVEAEIENEILRNKIRRLKGLPRYPDADTLERARMAIAQSVGCPVGMDSVFAVLASLYSDGWGVRPRKYEEHDV